MTHFPFDVLASRPSESQCEHHFFAQVSKADMD